MPKNIVEIDCGEDLPKKYHRPKSQLPRPYTYSLPTSCQMPPTRHIPSPPPLVPTVVGSLTHSPAPTPSVIQRRDSYVSSTKYRTQSPPQTLAHLPTVNGSRTLTTRTAIRTVETLDSVPTTIPIPTNLVSDNYTMLTKTPDVNSNTDTDGIDVDTCSVESDNEVAGEDNSTIAKHQEIEEDDDDQSEKELTIDVSV